MGQTLLSRVFQLQCLCLGILQSFTAPVAQVTTIYKHQIEHQTCTQVQISPLSSCDLIATSVHDHTLTLRSRACTFSIGRMPCGQYASHKPPRAALACDLCRLAKTKCDQGRPTCGRCEDNKSSCIYRQSSQPQPTKAESKFSVKIGVLRASSESLLARFEKQDAVLQMILDKQNRSFEPSQVAQNHDYQMASAIELGSQHRHPRASATPLPTQEPDTSDLRQYQQATRNVQREDNNSDVQFSMPPKHTTAVHHLFDWPSIRTLMPPKQITSYVMDIEQAIGLLRLCGRVESQDTHNGCEGVPSPSSCTSAGRTHNATSAFASRQSEWGSSQLQIPPTVDDRYVREHPAGINAGDDMALDSSAIDQYFRSYMENMHILHPFLEPKVLRKMVQVFKRKYSWDRIHPDITVNGKRKREGSQLINSPDTTAATSKVPTSTIKPIRTTYPVIEHSVANAVTLLVLALGKVCVRREQLPEAVLFSSVWPSKVHDQGNSAFQTAPSLSAPPSPISQHLLNDDSHIMAVANSAAPLGKNTDRIPGFSYFAKAATILGELPGGVGVSYIQANLLAGLYMGQLARITPSLYYISIACRACQVVIKSTAYQTAPDQPEVMKPSRRNLINFAFWSCLQLESDILAEVELPPSGITRYERQQHREIPTGVTLESIPESDGQKDILRFYSYQVQIRRTLNDIHSILYRIVPSSNELQKPCLVLLNTLDTNLELWRGMLDDWQWNDADHQSTNINIARMRAKYYGAKYIIHRPALHYALRVVGVQPSRPNSEHSNSPQAQSPPVSSACSLTARDRNPREMPPPGRTADIGIEAWITCSARKCIDAAIRSTTAFDAISGRLIITNIFGTLHA